METPFVTRSTLRQSASTTILDFFEPDFSSESDLSPSGGFVTGRYCEFQSTGLFLVVAYATIVNSSRNMVTEEALPTNLVKALVVDSTGANATAPFGVWPSQVTVECKDHTHTFTGGPTSAAIRGVDVDSVASFQGGSRRSQLPMQFFFLVAAKAGDRLFVWRDYVPQTYITYELVRLCPAMLTPGGVEI